MNENQIDTQLIISIAQKAKGLKLLYVEDNELAREATLETLNVFFKDIVVSVNGQEGLDSFKENNFDLIITDINMPKMNGIDMIKNIRELNSEIKIIVLSAHDDPEYFKTATEFQVEGYLLKPIHLTNLVTLLERTLESITQS